MGSRMIALCSKCYFIDEGEGEKNKFSTKGMLKKQNEITWQRFKVALEGTKDVATNLGFRIRDGQDGNAPTTKAWALRVLQKKMGAARWGTHRTNQTKYLVYIDRRENSIGRDNKQFFTYEPPSLDHHGALPLGLWGCPPLVNNIKQARSVFK